MANHAADSNEEKYSIHAANSKWPDLYALLEVTPDTDVETLRRRIREAYVEATANTDHRNIERRIHFQTMSERIIPQCRRILLDPILRGRYDRELALHRAGDPNAQDYGTFVNTIGQKENNDNDGEAVPGKEGEFAQDLSVAPSKPSSAAEDATPRASAPVAPDTATSARSGTGKTAEKKSVEDYASAIRRERRAGAVPVSKPVPATDSLIGEGIAGLAEAAILPSEGVAGTVAGEPAERSPVSASPAASAPVVPVVPPSTQAVRETPNAATPQAVAPPVTAASAAPAPAAPTSPTISAPVTPTSVAATEAPAPDNAALYASVIRPEGPAIEAHSTTKLNLEDSSASVRASRTNEGSRISVGDNELSRRAAGSRVSRGKPVIGHRAQLLAMGICAALLTIYIMRANESNALAQRIPVRIAYASDMHGFMEAAEKQFEASDAGKAIDLDLRPMDSRAAMTSILSKAMPVDAWIPSESLWSDRYNEVAAQNKVRPINVARSVAISPCVLIARGDRARVLRERFPKGNITSWDALRAAVAAGAPEHFGLTDPTVSGAGAVARYFMAREWCRRNNVSWDKNAVNNAGLWKWLASFEDNVPGNAKLTSDMAKELALGTADRYWWAITYESDAITWLNKAKDIDVFYLPQTNYAEHPLCYIDRADAPQNSGQARAVFEQFLRSTPMQTLLIQNGLRPTEIEPTAAVKDNPFTNAKFKSHGLKRSGFTSDERINYRILNALNAAWSSRYK